MKAWSPHKFMEVTSVKETDEDGFLSRSMMIKAKNTIMKERIIDRVVDVNLRLQFLDRVIDVPIVMQQKRSPARLCFSLASRQWHTVTRGACDWSWKET